MAVSDMAAAVRRLACMAKHLQPKLQQQPPSGSSRAPTRHLAALFGDDSDDDSDGGSDGDDLDVAEAVMTLILAGELEDREDALAKLHRAMIVGGAAQAEAAVEAGAVEALAPLAAGAVAQQAGSGAELAAALLGQLAIVTAEASATIVRLGLGSAKALTPPAAMKLERSATRPSAEAFAALCGAACAGPAATAAVAAGVAELGQPFLVPAETSAATLDSLFHSLLGQLEAAHAETADELDAARLLGCCHALRLLVVGDPVTAAVGETVILLHPPLPLSGVSTRIKRGCKQNDSLTDG